MVPPFPRSSELNGRARVPHHPSSFPGPTAVPFVEFPGSLREERKILEVLKSTPKLPTIE